MKLVLQLEGRIQEIGRSIIPQIKGKIEDLHVATIRQYFEVNEYGEAAELLDWFVEDDPTLLEGEFEAIYRSLKSTMVEIRKAYGTEN